MRQEPNEGRERCRVVVLPNRAVNGRIQSWSVGKRSDRYPREIAVEVACFKERSEALKFGRWYARAVESKGENKP